MAKSQRSYIWGLVLLAESHVTSNAAFVNLMAGRTV